MHLIWIIVEIEGKKKYWVNLELRFFHFILVDVHLMVVRIISANKLSLSRLFSAKIFVEVELPLLLWSFYGMGYNNFGAGCKIRRSFW